MRVTDGPAMIRSENARPSGWVFVDIGGRDLGSFVAEARERVAAEIDLPPGYSLRWSGQYEYWERAAEKLRVVVPLTLAIIVLVLFLNFRTFTDVALILGSLPFALVGGVWLLWLLDYQLSVAVAVGFIALAGVAAETGVVMLIYLDHAWRDRSKHGAAPSLRDLYDAVVEGAVERVRPKMMTVTAIMAGLLPILWGTGAGASVMKRIAAPMVGGLATSFVLELLVYPALFALWKRRTLPVAR